MVDGHDVRGVTLRPRGRGSDVAPHRGCGRATPTRLGHARPSRERHHLLLRRLQGGGHRHGSSSHRHGSDRRRAADIGGGGLHHSLLRRRRHPDGRGDRGGDDVGRFGHQHHGTHTSRRRADDAGRARQRRRTSRLARRGPRPRASLRAGQRDRHPRPRPRPHLRALLPRRPRASRDTGGTGLGLSIVRHVANNHQGWVDVESREGEGSTFSLVLPLHVDRLL